MELTILKEKEVPLLERKRVSVSIASQSGKTPSRLSLVKDAAKLLKTKEENLVIRHIYSKFGSGASKAILHVYKNKATKEKFEEESLLKKHVGEAPAVEEAAPAAEVKAEEPKKEE